MTYPIIWPDDTARARLTDPLESHEAADATVGKRQASQAVVYRILLDAGTALTDEEIYQEAEAFCGYSPSRLRTARHELVEAGRVRAAGTVRPDGHRCRMNTWTVAQ